MDAEASLLHVPQRGSNKLVYMELPLSAQSSHSPLHETGSTPLGLETPSRLSSRRPIGQNFMCGLLHGVQGSLCVQANLVAAAVAAALASAPSEADAVVLPQLKAQHGPCHRSAS
jgi:hypothetical protein